MSMQRGLPMCWWCIHFIITKARIGYNYTCTAFPDEIPDEIYSLRTFDHREPYPGDQGIQFEQAPLKVIHQRRAFQHLQDPQILESIIQDMLRELDENRSKGLVQPPLFAADSELPSRNSSGEDR